MTFDIERAWFAYENHAAQPRASITTGDTTADATNQSPVAHALDLLTYRQWQAPSTSEYIEIDFGADVEVQAVCLVFPRITDPSRKYDVQEIISTDTILHQFDAGGGSPGTGAVFDSGTIACNVKTTRGYHVLVLKNPITARYWRATITTPSRASLGYFLLSMAAAFPVFQPEFNYTYGHRIAFEDNSEVSRTPIGQSAFVASYERTLEGSFSWDFSQDPERDLWADMDEYAGSTEPVLVGLPQYAANEVASGTAYVCEGDKVFLGLIESGLGITSRDFNTNIKRIQMKEHR